MNKRYIKLNNDYGKIKVRIFTYDDKSEIAIKKQLMNLTENI